MPDKILLDTNIIIHYIQGESIFVNYLNSKILNYSVLYISTVVVAELYSKSNITNEEVELIDEFINKINLIYVDLNIAKTAGFLRQRSKIKTPDALIAATAICNGLSLATENDKDFLNIEELKLESIPLV